MFALFKTVCHDSEFWNCRLKISQPVFMIQGQLYLSSECGRGWLAEGQWQHGDNTLACIRCPPSVFMPVATQLAVGHRWTRQSVTALQCTLVYACATRLQCVEHMMPWYNASEECRVSRTVWSRLRTPRNPPQNNCQYAQMHYRHRLKPRRREPIVVRTSPGDQLLRPSSR